MFEGLKAKKRAEKEAEQLAAYRARDAKVGNPTVATLNERLALAVRKGMWDIVDDCVQKGSPVDHPIDVSRNAHRDCYCPGFEAFPKELLPSFGQTTTTPLAYAVMMKDAAGAAKLVALGADVNKGLASTFQKATPLLLAANTGVAETVQLLCDNGAAIGKDNRPLQVAEKNDFLDVIVVLRAEEAKRAQAQVQMQERADTAEARAVLESVAKLPAASREWVLKSLTEKFPAPAPVTPLPEGLAQDVQVSKPLTLKKQA
ncbi:MAG: hypothetical protein ACAH83_01170 [Alphaproteobacteria bacterium]